MEYTGKDYDLARREGFLAREHEQGFEDTLVGLFILKYPKRIRTLVMLREILGGKYPEYSDINSRTIDKLRDKMEDEGVSQNSIRQYFAQLRSVCTDTRQVELTRKLVDSFNVKRIPSKSIYLTEGEIVKLERVQCTCQDERCVKFQFLVSCVTGCRHSDAKNVSLLNISDGNFSYVSQKTKSDTSMPAHGKLAWYISMIPEGVEVWEGRFNRIIRELCRRAGINEQVRVYHAGKEMVGEKWQFVASHTARRSFATNLYTRGIDLHGLSCMMGHSSATITENYLCARAPLANEVMDFFR